MYKVHTYFDELYLEAINGVLNNGTSQFNERTGTNVIAFHGMFFKWDMDFYPLLHLRKSFVKTGAAEVAWMLSGEQSTEWISKYTGIWKMFEDDNNPGTISTAYGYRWQHAFGVDQIANIIDKLKADPSSRQQVLMSWDASRDNVIPVKNVPCPYTAVINIIDGKLNIHLTLRSNDIIVGLPYDFLMYTLLGKLLANSLEVQVGVLSYAIAHAHIYENHYVMCSQMLITPYNKANETVSFMDTIEDARLYPDLFVASVTSNAMLTYKPNDWNPKPEVVQ
jgi:thymidylate synthase